MTKVQDQRPQSTKEQAYNVNKDKDHKSLTTKAMSMNSRMSVTMNSLRKERMICCRQLITKIRMKMRVLTDEVLNNLSASTCCRTLDTTTLRELISFEGRGVGAWHVCRGNREKGGNDHGSMIIDEVRIAILKCPVCTVFNFKWHNYFVDHEVTLFLTKDKLSIFTTLEHFIENDGQMPGMSVVFQANASLCNEYHQMDKIQAKPDKTEHEMKSVEKLKVNQSQQKVNPIKVKVKDEAEVKEMLNGPTRTHLIGR
nr:hypothetical protein [Tanacetum cinerariifolium]